MSTNEDKTIAVRFGEAWVKMHKHRHSAAIDLDDTAGERIAAEMLELIKEAMQPPRPEVKAEDDLKMQAAGLGVTEDNTALMSAEVHAKHWNGTASGEGSSLRIAYRAGFVKCFSLFEKLYEKNGNLRLEGPRDEDEPVEVAAMIGSVNDREYRVMATGSALGEAFFNAVAYAAMQEGSP